jgi:DNA-binding MarR family transcriptional regulator
MSTSNSVYLRFLALAGALEGQLVEEIDATAMSLLELIAVAADKGSPLTVTQAMNLTQLASPATLHRKLSQLVEAGYVEQCFEGKNRRTKYLVPTSKANKHFAQLGKVLNSAVFNLCNSQSDHAYSY